MYLPVNSTDFSVNTLAVSVNANEAFYLNKVLNSPDKFPYDYFFLSFIVTFAELLTVAGTPP